MTVTLYDETRPRLRTDTVWSYRGECYIPIVKDADMKGEDREESESSDCMVRSYAEEEGVHEECAEQSVLSLYCDLWRDSDEEVKEKEEKGR